MSGNLIEERFGHRDEDVKRQREKMVIYKPRGEAWNRSSHTALKRNQLCQHLGLRLPASRTVRPYILLFKPPSLWYFVTAAEKTNIVIVLKISDKLSIAYPQNKISHN